MKASNNRYIGLAAELSRAGQDIDDAYYDVKIKSAFVGQIKADCLKADLTKQALLNCNSACKKNFNNFTLLMMIAHY